MRMQSLRKALCKGTQLVLVTHDELNAASDMLPVPSEEADCGRDCALMEDADHGRDGPLEGDCGRDCGRMAEADCGREGTLEGEPEWGREGTLELAVELERCRCRRTAAVEL
jgi:uncharacterized low-complexity protein